MEALFSLQLCVSKAKVVVQPKPELQVQLAAPAARPETREVLTRHSTAVSSVLRIRSLGLYSGTYTSRGLLSSVVYCLMGKSQVVTVASAGFIFVTERFSSEPDQESLSCTPLGPGSKVVPRSIGFRRARLGTPWLLRQMPGTGRQMTSVAGRLSGASRMKKRLSSVSKMSVVLNFLQRVEEEKSIEEPEPELRARRGPARQSGLISRRAHCRSLVQGGGKRRRLSSRKSALPCKQLLQLRRLQLPC